MQFNIMNKEGSRKRFGLLLYVLFKRNERHSQWGKTVSETLVQITFIYGALIREEQTERHK